MEVDSEKKEDEEDEEDAELPDAEVYEMTIIVELKAMVDDLRQLDAIVLHLNLEVSRGKGQVASIKVNVSVEVSHSE